jgi:hypothetical protein
LYHVLPENVEAMKVGSGNDQVFTFVDCSAATFVCANDVVLAPRLGTYPYAIDGSNKYKMKLNNIRNFALPVNILLIVM